ncbi:hypothetical protein EDB89DRAFT_1902049 [Lactarius sanguifluus]|nr:hypothetical protein EDB89DRAFT_1902049 [Lactarius sanguifluus]
MSDGYKAKVVQSLLRDYCTAHIYHFEWKDPSKIQIGEVFRILDHWRHRQDQGIGPLMWVLTSPLFDNMDDPPSQDSNQEDDKAGSVKPSDDSSNDDSFDKTDATKSPDDSDDDLSENKMALGSPLHMSHMRDDAYSEDDRGSASTRSKDPNMAGPSQHPQVSEKVRNIDTGRGAAKVHPDIWSQNR